MLQNLGKKLHMWVQPLHKQSSLVKYILETFKIQLSCHDKLQLFQIDLSQKFYWQTWPSVVTLGPTQ